MLRTITIAACFSAIASIASAGSIFAILDDDNMAENLEYGTAVSALTYSSAAFFDVSLGNVSHSSWTQKISDTGDLVNDVDMTISWAFSSTKTLEDRFLDAQNSGEAVT